MHRDDLGDRSEIAQGIDGHLRDQMLVDREVAQRSQEERMAVGRRARGEFGAIMPLARRGCPRSPAGPRLR